jgi:chaperonin GroEL (HSP60 family)
MWLLGFELRTFGRAVRALNRWAISPAHLTSFCYLPLIGCVVPGAGAVEVAIAEALVNYKHRVQGRVRLGIQAFADALLIIPKVQLCPGQITTGAPKDP